MAVPAVAAGAAAAKLAPPIIGGIISAGGSLLSNVFGGLFGNSKSKSLMSYQNKLFKDQQSWLFRNQYQGMVSGMRQAGLNPAFSAGSQPMITAQMPSATNTSYTPFDLGSLSEIAKVASEIKLNEANAENVSQDTEKKRQETENLQFVNDTNWDRLYSDLAYQKSMTNYNVANTGVAEAQNQVLWQTVENMKVEYDNLLTNFAQNLLNLQLTQKEIDVFDSKVRSIIALNFANAGYLNDKNAREAQEQMYKLFNYSALSSMYESQANMNNAQAALTDYTLQLDKEFGSTQRTVNMVSQIIGSLGAAIGAGFGAFFGTNSIGRMLSKPVSVKGFGR